MKKIKLSEVIKICKKLQKGKINDENFEKELSPICVTGYIPLMEKYRIISLILLDENEEEKSDIQDQMLYMQNCKFWKILLAYTNIDLDSEPDIQTIQNQDLIMSTIGYYIISLCRIDYDEFVKMLESTINLYNVERTLSLIGNVDIEKIKQEDKQVRESAEYLNTNYEKIADLINVLKK